MARHVRLDLSVWKRNREVADAFHDPMLDGRPGALETFLSGPAAPWLGVTLALGAVCIALVLIAVQYRGSGSTAPLQDVAAAPNSIPAPAPEPEKPVPVAAIAGLSPAAAPASPGFPASGYGLVASKRDRTLYVYFRDGKQWKKTAAFPMAFGRNAGDKIDAGDRRTPEGRYWITGIVAGPAKGPLYGSLVFTLNYPTPGDQADGKTGEGIWIHGVEEGKRPSYTRGCLSLANDDVLALAAFADVGTPILILSDTLAPDPARQMDEAGMASEYPALMAAYGRRTRQDTLQKEEALRQAKAFVARETGENPDLALSLLTPQDKQAIMARLARWREDWCGRAVEAYAANYAADFRDAQGRDKMSFLDRKRAIFASKTRIDMDMGKPEMVSEGYGRAKVSFRQEYQAEGEQGVQRSSGMKTLRMEAGPEGWLIVNE